MFYKTTQTETPQRVNFTLTLPRKRVRAFGAFTLQDQWNSRGTITYIAHIIYLRPSSAQRCVCLITATTPRAHLWK